MAVNTVGFHRDTPRVLVDADSDAILNMRLSTVLEKLERRHAGTVKSYVGGPNPERTLHFRDEDDDMDVRATLQVRDHPKGIWVMVPMENQACIEWLDGDTLAKREYDNFIRDAHPADIFEGITVRDEALYGPTRYLFSYTSSGPGRHNKTMTFVAQYAAHIARFLDSLLCIAIEESLTEPDDEPAQLLADLLGTY
jgi:hypothetical protein